MQISVINSIRFNYLHARLNKINTRGNLFKIFYHISFITKINIKDYGVLKHNNDGKVLILHNILYIGEVELYIVQMANGTTIMNSSDTSYTSMFSEVSQFCFIYLFAFKLDIHGRFVLL